MSYWINLKIPNTDDIVTVDNHSDGGTYVLGGTAEASLNVTYNYNRYYTEYLDSVEGIRWLRARRAKDTIERMEEAVRVLGIVRDEDYWKATPGNAGYALSILLRWAKQHPDAVFEVH